MGVEERGEPCHTLVKDAREEPAAFASINLDGADLHLEQEVVAWRLAFPPVGPEAVSINEVRDALSVHAAGLAADKVDL